MKPEGKKAETMTKLNKKKLQTTISEKLAELPGNRRKILELRIEKERIPLNTSYPSSQMQTKELVAGWYWH